LKDWRVGALKEAEEESSNLFCSNEATIYCIMHGNPVWDAFSVDYTKDLHRAWPLKIWWCTGMHWSLQNVAA